MKKVLLATAAVILMTGCSQNEEFENEAKQVEIGFNSVISKSARAAIVENANFESFVVNGYRTSAAMSEVTALKKDFMNDVNVEKDEGGNWKQTGSFYWPALPNYVHFFATSPAVSLTLPTAGYPTFAYTVGAIDTQKDLLAANLVDQQKSANKVNLTFRHLLTQINFSIKGDTKNFTYSISQLKVTGVGGAATYTFNKTGGAWGTTTTTTAEYVYDLGTAKEITIADDLGVVTPLETSGNSLFMLIPQTLTDAAEVSIKYYAIPTGKTDALDKTFDGEKTVKLGTVTNWEANKKVRYTLILSSDATQLEMGAPSITPWDAPEADGGDLTPAE